MSHGHPVVLFVAFLNDEQSTAAILNNTGLMMVERGGKDYRIATTSAFFTALAVQSQLILSLYERIMNFA